MGLLAAAALAAACSPPPRSTAPVEACREVAWDGVPRPRNVVLVVNDTMRRDRVGIYGGLARTPVFDRLAREGFYFERMDAPAPWTKPSIATLFTGLHPSQHGVLTHPDLPRNGQPRRGRRLRTDVLAEDVVTLAEVMKQGGYRTAAFVANPWLKHRFGFAQGFDLYEDAFARGWQASGEEVVRAALAWLEDAGGAEPFFLYVHTIDSHGPYGRLDEADLERAADRIAADERPLYPGSRNYLTAQVRMTDGRPVAAAVEGPLRLAHLDLAYEKGIENFDHALGLLLNGLASHPASAETAILVTSDHGEALFERGWANHGRGLFDDEVGIPFAARMPGTTVRGPVDCPAGLVDVMVTLCTYLGLACPAANAGTSFLPAPGASGPPPPRYIVSEGVMSKPEHRAIRNEDYLLLYEPQGRPLAQEGSGPWFLYPVEGSQLDDSELLAHTPRPAAVEAAFQELAAGLRGAVPAYRAPQAPDVPLDIETRQQLEALGYLGDHADPGPETATE